MSDNLIHYILSFDVLRDLLYKSEFRGYQDVNRTIGTPVWEGQGHLELPLSLTDWNTQSLLIKSYATHLP